LLVGFKQLYPRVVPRVVVGNSALIESRVASRELDLGLIEIVTEQPMLERRSAGRDELLMICRPDHPLATAKTVRAADLVAHPFITRDPGNAIRELADQFFEAARINPEDVPIAAELGSLAAVKLMASEGYGYGIASREAITRDVGEGRIVAVPLDPPLYTPLEVIFPKDKFRSRLITTFADFATDEFARRASA